VIDYHVHALVAPLADYDLKDILHFWEILQRASDAVRAWALRPCLAERVHFYRIIPDDMDFAQKRDYIIANPWK
jgi:hypothetical protein